MHLVYILNSIKPLLIQQAFVELVTDETMCLRHCSDIGSKVRKSINPFT